MTTDHLHCPPWAKQQGNYLGCGGNTCQNCGLTIWDHITPTPDARILAQQAANDYPYTHAWIPCKGSIPLGTPATIEHGTSRKAVRVIGSRVGAIMLDYAP